MGTLTSMSELTTAKAARMLPLGWTTKMESEGFAEGSACYTTEIFRNGRSMCRILLAGAFASHEAADNVLAKKTRKWIDEFEVRGSTRIETPASASSQQTAS